MHTIYTFILAFFICFSTSQAKEYVECKTTEDPSSYNEVYVNGKDAKTYCRVYGKGEPIVVLHGGPGLSQDYLLPEMIKLSRKNLLIFYDQRASGKSEGELTEASINLTCFLQDIESIRKHFGYKKITLLRHSWGAFLAMTYASKFPNAVERLILMNLVPASSEEMAVCMKNLLPRMEPYQKELSAIKESRLFLEGDPTTTEHYLKLSFCLFLHDPKKIDLLNLRLPPKAFLNGQKVDELFKKTLDQTYNLHEELMKLPVPTLVIAGDSDPILPCTAESIHKSIPNSSYLLIPNCGHFPHIEKPEILLERIETFLEENP